MIRDGNTGDVLDFFIKRAWAGMEIASLVAKLVSARLWFNMECKECGRLVREARKCFRRKNDNSSWASYCRKWERCEEVLASKRQNGRKRRRRGWSSTRK